MEHSSLDPTFYELQPCKPGIKPIVLPAPEDLTTLFAEKAHRLTDMLSKERVRCEAAEILSRLIESVTIYPREDAPAEAEVIAKIVDLAAFATNGNAAPGGGVVSSVKLVAGTGFEPVTFRL